MCIRRNRVLIVVACLLAGCSGGGRAPVVESGSEWFVAVSKSLPAPAKGSVGRHLQELIGAGARPGDVVHVIATPDQTPLASIIVPDGNRGARLRDKNVREGLAAVAPLLQGEPSAAGQAGLPSLPMSVRSLRRTTFPCRVILVGSPVYDDPLQSGWSMTAGVVPTDGALAAGKSPFGRSDGFPQGTEVSWFVPTPDWGVDQTHRDAVTRFIRLFVQERGGRLMRLTADAASAFDFDVAQFEGQVTKRDEASGMRVASVRSVRPRSVPPNQAVTVPLIAAPANAPMDPRPPQASTAAPAEPTAEQVLARAEADRSEIAIAINWQSEDPTFDCDIWLADRTAPEELCFSAKKTAFGELFRDVTRSGSIGAAGEDFSNWEWCRVNHDRLQDLTLWINAYRTTKPATVRVIRVWRGERKEMVIPFPVTSGDGARGRGQRERNPAWLKIAL